MGKDALNPREAKPTGIMDGIVTRQTGDLADQIENDRLVGDRLVYREGQEGAGDEGQRTAKRGEIGGAADIGAGEEIAAKELYAR
ncbi:hypothetical protein GALL_553720 [mine drainage metagenome]|uniref:Uncharacterized protein n=1 Tax=mine drainage metagenome TaxID=410659 RepID=A0A1J5P6M7_9ZZZZ